VEPGDTIEIVFDPAGLNAALGDSNTIRALTIGSITLPNADLALSFSFEDRVLYQSVSPAGGPAFFIACRAFGAQGVEYELSREAPRITLEIKKTDLKRLLGDNGQPD
jgi:hypothetical protein